MNFTVYKSSAGSGKTYTLVKEYLKIALNGKEDNYRGILAITFTNKATAEMKERILSALKDLSAGKTLSGTNQFLQNDLIEELKILPGELTHRARLMLTHILHHYSDFSISTIDKFVHKVVRAFARDLQIPMNFEVELDDELLLKNAVDKLIAKAGTDALITRVLVEFAEKKADDEKSWKIENDLLEFAKESLKEEAFQFAGSLKDIELSQFIRIKKELLEKVQNFKHQIKVIGGEGKGIILKAGVDPASFAGGKNGIVKYFGYLSECRDEKLLPSSTVQKNIDEDKWFAAKATAEDRRRIINIKKPLEDCFRKALVFLDSHMQDYILSGLMLENLFPMAVLKELDIIIDEIKREKNIVHISEFNKKIASIVNTESAPFIYERIGEKYRHFLIDEFQDTSALQWMNLLPLVHNSLSEGNFNMLVGDGKQAIYRWRSGDVEQFANLPSISNPDKNDLIEERRIALMSNYSAKFLTRNFRSKKEIVEFNNYFFENLSLRLNEKYKAIYESHGQQSDPANEGGSVNFEILQEGDFREKNFNKIFEIITESGKNYKLGEISILCRKNSDAGEIAAFLLEKNIPVISSESLLLAHSPEVNFLVSFLRFMDNPGNPTFKNAIKIFLFENNFIRGTNLHSVLASPDSFIFFLRKQGLEIDLLKLRQLSLYELAEELVRIFSFNCEANPYITFFLEFLHSFVIGDSVSISDFLGYWDIKKFTASIIVPEGMDAVHIMTIHKAKGLEFPIVIFPFANWQENVTKEYCWVTLPQPVRGLKTGLLKMKKELEQTIFADIYLEEKNKSKLDNFNLLYVALTRAKERLYVISSQEHQKNLSKNFIDILKNHSFWNEESQSILYPQNEESKVQEKVTLRKENAVASDSTYSLEEVMSSDWREKIQISRNSEKPEMENQRNYGKLVHYALSFINSEEDLDLAMEKLSAEFPCDENEKLQIMEKLTSLLRNPLINPFFASGLTIKNEADILLPDGEYFRPDRVVMFENRTVIIDYKTGSPREKHKEQVENYSMILREMGYRNIEKYLVYTAEEKVVRI